MQNTIFIDGVKYTENDIKELLIIRDKHNKNCKLFRELNKGRINTSETNFNPGAVTNGS